MLKPLRIPLLSTLLLALTLLTESCVRETPVVSDHMDNFEALWTIIDERYCYLDEKGVDWDAIHQKYKTKIEKAGKMNDLQFFSLLDAMLGELKDGHVNLVSSFNVGRYNGWAGEESEGFNYYSRKRLLGDDYLQTGGIKYVKLLAHKNNSQAIKVGYMLYPSFLSSIGDLNFVFSFFNDCEGIILDLRGNGGGLVSNADRLLSRFIDERQLVGYTSHKRSPARGDFSDPKPLYLSPSEGKRWTHKPVLVLQDRGCYSSTNDFLYKSKVALNIIRIGLPSGGGAGMPAMAELPNGWCVRYSAVKSYDKDMHSTEGGVAPDIYQKNTPFDANPKANDLILNRALLCLDSLLQTNK